MAFNRSYNKGCPCDKECPGRNEECHASCERYRAWRDQKDRDLESRHEAKQGYDLITHEKKVALWKKSRRSGRSHINPVIGRN